MSSNTALAMISACENHTFLTKSNYPVLGLLQIFICKLRVLQLLVASQWPPTKCFGSDFCMWNRSPGKVVVHVRNASFSPLEESLQFIKVEHECDQTIRGHRGRLHEDQSAAHPFNHRHCCAANHKINKTSDLLLPLPQVAASSVYGTIVLLASV